MRQLLIHAALTLAAAGAINAQDRPMVSGHLRLGLGGPVYPAGFNDAPVGLTFTLGIDAPLRTQVFRLYIEGIDFPRPSGDPTGGGRRPPAGIPFRHAAFGLFAGTRFPFGTSTTHAYVDGAVGLLAYSSLGPAFSGACGVQHTLTSYLHASADVTFTHGFNAYTHSARRGNTAIWVSDNLGYVALRVGLTVH